MNQKPARKGKLNFTVDFPALYAELTGGGNIHNLGAGGAMGLRLVLLGLKGIAVIALKEDHKELLYILSDLGIIVGDDGEFLTRDATGVSDNKKGE